MAKIIPTTLLAAALAALALAAPARAEEPAEPAAPVLTAITITGNEHTDETLIRRIMGVKIGDPLDMDGMDAAWDALEDCGHFRFVEMDYDDDGDEVVLNVMVEEDLNTFYGPMVEYSRRHKYRAGAWIEQRNLRGKGETLRAEVGAFYKQDATVSWHRPWLLGVDGLDLTVKGFGEQADFVFRPFRYRKYEAGLEPRWNFGGPFFVLAEARYGQFEQRDEYAWEIPARGPGTPEGRITFPAGKEHYWLFRGGVGLDTRDNPFYPQGGLFLEADAGRWTSSDFDSYHQFSADARAFVPLPWQKHVLALRAWGRRVDGPTHLDNLLYFGGPETVRGYPYASREGDEGYLLSAEYRMPLFLMPISPQGEIVGFGFHLFADAGDAWFEGADPVKSMFSYGAGAHVNITRFQLRFEAARTREGEWMFEFMDRFNF
jgi:outer membrane protein assembly factor BamA